MQNMKAKNCENISFVGGWPASNWGGLTLTGANDRGRR